MMEVHKHQQPRGDREFMHGNGLAIGTATPSGLHEFVRANVLARYAHEGVRAADLGAGPGALSEPGEALAGDLPVFVFGAAS